MRSFENLNKRWCRLGVSLYFTDDELKRLEKETGEVITEALVAGRVVVDGDTYFPTCDLIPAVIDTDLGSISITTASYILWNNWDDVTASPEIFEDLMSAVTCRDILRKMWEKQGFYTDSNQDRISVDLVMEHIEIRTVG